MKLILEKVNYKYEELEPVMSKQTLVYHRDNLANGYVKRFNAGEGDLEFNEAGAFLHNIFFPQLKKPLSSNKPTGSSKEFIERHFNTFEEFKDELSSKAMGIQGSGWVYLASDGKIKTIKNHQIKTDIILLIDWWEHAWSLDYKSDKRSYLKNIWKIINWDVVNDRLNISKKSNRFLKIETLHKTALPKSSNKRVFSQEFRRWLRENVYNRKLSPQMDLVSRIRLSNYFFKNEDDSTQDYLYEQWLKEKQKDKKSESEKKVVVENEIEKEPVQLELFSSYEEDLKKEAVLKRKKRKTRGKGKRDRMEWGLFSKSKPEKVLRWFGPKKPSKEMIAKEEARIHAFS